MEVFPYSRLSWLFSDFCISICQKSLGFILVFICYQQISWIFIIWELFILHSFLKHFCWKRVLGWLLQVEYSLSKNLKFKMLQTQNFLSFKMNEMLIGTFCISDFWIRNAQLVKCNTNILKFPPPHPGQSKI